MISFSYWLCFQAFAGGFYLMRIIQICSFTFGSALFSQLILFLARAIKRRMKRTQQRRRGRTGKKTHNSFSQTTNNYEGVDVCARLFCCAGRGSANAGRLSFLCRRQHNRPPTSSCVYKQVSWIFKLVSWIIINMHTCTPRAFILYSNIPRPQRNESVKLLQTECKVRNAKHQHTSNVYNAADLNYNCYNRNY